MKTIESPSLLLQRIESYFRPKADSVYKYPTGHDHITFAWMPESRYGVVLQDSHGHLQQYPKTDIQEEQECFPGFFIDVLNNGTIKLLYGTRSSNNSIDITISSLVEFEEIEWFFSKANIKKGYNSEPITKSLDDLIESPFMMLSDCLHTGLKPNDARLLPLTAKAINSLGAELTNHIEGCVKANQSESSRTGISATKKLIDDYFQQGPLDQAGTPPQTLEPRDIVVFPDDYTRNQSTTAFMLGELAIQEDWDMIPDKALFVLRPKQDVSIMWLMDFLCFAIESEPFVKRLHEGWTSAPTTINEMKITIPRGRAQQARRAVERRIARKQYLSAIDNVMRIREPFHSSAQTYHKRSLAVSILHSEFLEDIMAAKMPLPYFIEYPYRAFIKSRDGRDRVRTAQRLMTIFAKIPLFLAVEELNHRNLQLGTDYLEEIRARPQSDGTLIELLERLLTNLENSKVECLSVFRELLNLRVIFKLLGRLVEARNRFHHDPFDEEGFVSTMQEVSPSLINAFRTALGKVNFAIPRNLKVNSGVVFAVAEDITGSDGLFEIRDYHITENIGAFESGKLIAFTDHGEDVVSFSTLLNIQTVTRSTIDFAIFDRMSNKGPEYTLLRD